MTDDNIARAMRTLQEGATAYRAEVLKHIGLALLHDTQRADLPVLCVEAHLLESIATKFGGETWRNANPELIQEIALKMFPEDKNG